MADEQDSGAEKRSNLGRGLAALFGEEEETPLAGRRTAEPAQRLPVEHLHPSELQPRRHFPAEETEALADSIRENGILQPILVREHPKKAGEYEIIAGERRWRAAQLARLHEVPVVLRELSDQKVLEVAIVENVQRQDLTPLEEAEGYHRLIEEFGHSQAAVASAVGKSRSHVANTLRLLNLPDALKDLLEKGELTAGHARALLGAEKPEDLAKKVLQLRLNVRETEDLVQRAREIAEGKAGSGKPGDLAARMAAAQDPDSSRTGASGSPAGKGAGKDADTLALERDLTAILGLKVTINFHGLEKGESGSLTIHYDTLEQLDDVLRRLHQTPQRGH